MELQLVKVAGHHFYGRRRHPGMAEQLRRRRIIGGVYSQRRDRSFQKRIVIGMEEQPAIRPGIARELMPLADVARRYEVECQPARDVDPRSAPNIDPGMASLMMG